MGKKVVTGLEALKKDWPDFLRGQRIGLLANSASVDSEYTHAVDILEQKYPGHLKALFSPQHGFFAEKQDNMIESGHARHGKLNIPLFSLYSETRIPTTEMFDLIDTLVIDIQDVGTRVYTFIYTVSYCLEQAAKTGKTVVVLDRPNPIGGIQVEGNVLEPGFASFVGRYPIPMRHGMTLGEIAQFFNQVHGIGCDLKVIPMKDWKREMYWQDTCLPWILPSPNLPTPLSAMVYPGQVIFEGTNISEGRGTTLPFEQFGSPFMDTDLIISKASPLIKGAHLRQVNFQPTSGKWQDQVCRGIHIHVISRLEFKPYFSSLVLLQLIMAAHQDCFEFKAPPYEYEYEKLPMDLILGSRDLREKIFNMADITKLESDWEPAADKFKTLASKFHLYE